MSDFTPTQRLVSHLQSTLGRLQCDLVVSAHAIKGSQIEMRGEVDHMRLFVAAELIERTQQELSSLASELAKR